MITQRRWDLRGVGKHKPRLRGGDRLWQCRCGDPWPCAAARRRLLIRYGYGRRLGELAFELLEQAVRDLPHLSVSQLYDRFIAWTLPPEPALCRQHDPGGGTRPCRGSWPPRCAPDRP
ncbi:hypothetical protein JQS43_21915 [Natronosporangium hydrolyticum]|uniref:Uncharacterized protein n=1 Tax=Natronosporangium hydrolyticum TaxID=2811111 RepID=A0A895YFG5_9ACTN|nr:hypothetical protein [Natronosporangium hydrolyticum]QSB14153.1 hypothetical protein JQS43_21915 [Natronosporangium hydrolyticum]